LALSFRLAFSSSLRASLREQLNLFGDDGQPKAGLGRLACARIKTFPSAAQGFRPHGFQIHDVAIVTASFVKISITIAFYPHNLPVLSRFHHFTAES